MDSLRSTDKPSPDLATDDKLELAARHLCSVTNVSESKWRTKIPEIKAALHMRSALILSELMGLYDK